MSEAARSEGEAVLEAVGAGSSSSSSSSSASGGNGGGGTNSGNGVTLSLLSVRVEGFGPFASPAEYDLSSGGVRVLTGRNVDAAGTGSSSAKAGGGSSGFFNIGAVDAPADSNGAGKTSLAMAPHWAITGRSDARADGGGGRGLTHADVVNDGCDSASVIVRGTVLSGGGGSGVATGAAAVAAGTPVPFELERAVSRKKLLRLRLRVGGEDLTGADARLTQATVDSLLGAPLISRASFLGQADAMSLLEAGDAELKGELSKVALDGAAWVGDRLIVRCAAALGETLPSALLPLYTAHRALIRARLAMAHLQDEHPRTPERWPLQAAHYLERALAAIELLEALGHANSFRTARRSCSP